MSAWPEAAWIVKKLQKNFDFSEQITYYTRDLNSLRTEVNNLNISVENLNNSLQQKKAQIDLSASVIRATKNNTGLPNTSDNYTKGTLWLVLKS